MFALCAGKLISKEMWFSKTMTTTTTATTTYISNGLTIQNGTIITNRWNQKLFPMACVVERSTAWPIWVCFLSKENIKRRKKIGKTFSVYDECKSRVSLEHCRVISQCHWRVKHSGGNTWGWNAIA